ncbi:hypothetical protein HZB60_00355 [candidate division KSB1 bacterium]|nr:hypothetical protein [candidate division KSB1 bacterium]
MHRFLRSLLVLFALRPALAAEPWILRFPEISYDDRHVYFCGERWCGYLSVGLEAMLTVPRDSVSPPPLPPTEIVSVLLNGEEYVARGSEILLIHPPAPDSAYTLLSPGLESMRLLSELVSAEDRPALDPVELTGPITAARSRVFFGLQLRDRSSGAMTGGIGWIDPATQQLARIYTPALQGLKPVWIAAIGDTIHALFEQTRQGERVKTKWIRCSATAPELFEIDLAQNGIPGEVIIAMQQWHGLIVLSTDEAVAVHRPTKTVAWTTRTYAPLQSDWLYLRKFTAPGLGDTVRFLSIPKGRPTIVKAWIKDWVEVGSPDGVEAYVDPRQWVADSSLWTQTDWGCEKPCFARVRVPSKGAYLEGDLTDTPLTLIGFDTIGAKVGFRAAWIPARRLAPVLLPVR